MPYSTSFYLNELTELESDVYTVPDDYVAVLRDLEGVNNSGEASNFSLVATIPGPLSLTIIRFIQLGASDWAQWQGRVVLPAGTIIELAAEFYSWYVALSGYLLSSP